MAKPTTVDTAHIETVDYDDVIDELITGEAVALSLRPASFVLRAAGTIIDFLLYGVGLIGATVLVFAIGDGLGFDDAILRAISVVLLVLFLAIIPAAVETISHGKSLGKLAAGAKIVRDDGGPIRFRHAMIRALVGVFEIFLTVGSIAALVGLLSGRSKRMGDLLAGTYAQNERVARATEPQFSVPTPLIPWSQTADVARLPDGLARRVASFLAQASRLTPATRERISIELAHQVAVFVSPVPEAPAELFLAAVSCLRREREGEALRLQRTALESLAPALQGLPRGFPDRG